MPSVIFSKYSVSKVFDRFSAPNEVKGVPEDIEVTKDFDYCSPHLYVIYCIMGGYFGGGKINIKKMGKSWDDVREYIDKYSPSLGAGTLSQYLKKVIVKIPFDYDTLVNISEARDVLSVTNNLFAIHDCIEYLKTAEKNMRLKEIEKLTTAVIVVPAILNPDVEEKTLRQFWEKRCTNPACYVKNCCYDKRALSKISYNVSLLRSGCRSYGASLNPGNIHHVKRLICILENAVSLIKSAPLSTNPLNNNLVMLTV
jgi:hypothetical protein